MPNPSSDKPDLSPHPLVTKLLGGSDTPPNLIVVTGCLGPSKNMDSVRLYTDASFQSYLEIPKAAIVATTPVDAKDELSPTIVHVKAGTHVEAVHTSTQPVESYLQGGITGEYLQGASTGAVHPDWVWTLSVQRSCAGPCGGRVNPAAAPAAEPTYPHLCPTPTATFIPWCRITPVICTPTPIICTPPPPPPPPHISRAACSIPVILCQPSRVPHGCQPSHIFC